MAAPSSDTIIKFTWSQLLKPYGNYLVGSYDHTDDCNDDTENYDDENCEYDDIEAYDGYNYNDDDDTEEYVEDNDDDDDDEDGYYEYDDDDYSVNYNNYNHYNYNWSQNQTVPIAHHSYIFNHNYSSIRYEIPILPEKAFPSTLYRIHYSESVTQYSHEGGFLANNQYSSGPVRLKEFHDHLNWRSRTPSRFISTFSDRSHAFAWAKNWQQKHPYGRYFIMTIRPRATDTIYHMETVIDRSGVGIPSHCSFQMTQPDEYLFFRHIPEDRIVEIFDPDMKDPLNSWDVADLLSSAPYCRLEGMIGARRDLHSDDLLLALSSLSIGSGW
ncbi:hypothetical protein AA313_de0200793 [Arthrobotrys entomopaga]|nr:hypothetical protein AA313_de0200793 [Arthrobotrys entomopaga]